MATPHRQIYYWPQDGWGLMKHLLSLQGFYERYLVEYESLAPLRDVPENGREIFLDDRPTLVHPYFTEHGIYL